jgi:hypothetical protein
MRNKLREGHSVAPWTAPCAAGRLAVRVVDETGRGGPCIFRCVRMRDVSERHGWVSAWDRRTRTLRTHVNAAAVAASWKRDGACTCEHMHVMARHSISVPITRSPRSNHAYVSSAASMYVCMYQCQSRLASSSNRVPPYRDLSTRWYFDSWLLHATILICSHMSTPIISSSHTCMSMKMRDTAMYSTFVLPWIKGHTMHDTPQVTLCNFQRIKAVLLITF